MKERNWAVDAFLFQYKKKKYVVLVKLYSDGEKKDSKYAIVKLEFIKKGHSSENYRTYADLYKICIADIKEFRKFFDIEYNENLGTLLNNSQNIFLISFQIN